jgi:hypothetical protein
MAAFEARACPSPSPGIFSRVATCPVCAKDVHKVLLAAHVELCLEKANFTGEWAKSHEGMKGTNPEERGAGEGGVDHPQRPTTVVLENVTTGVTGDVTASRTTPARTPAGQSGPESRARFPTPSALPSGFSTASLFAKHLNRAALNSSSNNAGSGGRGMSSSALSALSAATPQQQQLQPNGKRPPRSPFGDLAISARSNNPSTSAGPRNGNAGEGDNAVTPGSSLRPGEGWRKANGGPSGGGGWRGGGSGSSGGGGGGSGGGGGGWSSGGSSSSWKQQQRHQGQQSTPHGGGNQRRTIGPLPPKIYALNPSKP